MDHFTSFALLFSDVNKQLSVRRINNETVVCVYRIKITLSVGGNAFEVRGGKRQELVNRCFYYGRALFVLIFGI